MNDMNQENADILHVLQQPHKFVHANNGKQPQHFSIATPCRARSMSLDVPPTATKVGSGKILIPGVGQSMK